MLTLLASWLIIASVPLSTSPAEPHSSDDCEDTRRLELSLPVLTPPRLCISPGTLTGVIFDHPVTVELQDEVRFIEVTRGRAGIAFIPPRDLRPGETLRLTAAVGTAETAQSLTFVLVTHLGHGSHQIEVSYRPRTWQSMTDVLSQALLTNQWLRTENAALSQEGVRLRAQLDQPTGLCAAFVGGQLSEEWGVVARRVDVSQSSTDALNVARIASYRGSSHIAVQVLLSHQTSEPWSMEKATLVNERGEQLEALRHRQTGALPPGEQRPVFVEFDPTGFTPGRASLRLTGTGARVVTLSNVVFP